MEQGISATSQPSQISGGSSEIQLMIYSKHSMGRAAKGETTADLVNGQLIPNSNYRRKLGTGLEACHLPI